jgi:hypothetical protein
MAYNNVPQQQFARQVAQQGVRELGGPLPVDAARVDPKVELPERQAGDDRELVLLEGLAQHRRLATERPGAHPVGGVLSPLSSTKTMGRPSRRAFF